MGFIEDRNKDFKVGLGIGFAVGGTIVNFTWYIIMHFIG